MTQSTITGNIGGRNIDVIEVSKQVELDTFEKIDWLMPADNISIFNIRGQDFQLYADNNLFASGIIVQRPSFQIIEGKNCIKVSGLSELGRISCERAYSLAYYEDELITTILTDLLSRSNSGFVLDSTSFADAGTAVTTIDLRSKENLFSQISEVVKSYPSLHMRERIDGNNSFLEIGEFDTLLYQATEGINLIDISLQADSKRVLNIVEAYGGLSPTVRVSLNDSITDGRALVSPYFAQFPIIVDGNGLTYVENTSVLANCSTVKDFELHKTDNESTVTQQQINDAAFALYQKAVRYLQQNDQSQEYDLTLTMPLERLTIGDRIQVNSKIVEEYYNEVTNSYESAEIFEVNEDYRITNINTSLESFSFEKENGLDTGLLYEYSVRVTNSEDTANYDPEVELYERLNKPSEIPSLDALQIATPVSLRVTHNEGTDPTDCTLGSGEDGKEFTFDVATNSSTWATGKQIIVSSLSPSDVLYDITTYNQNDLSDVVICVSGTNPNKNWGAAGKVNDVEVSIVVIYT